MTATDLPAWVYDLAIDLIDQHEVHPKLLFESGAFKGTRQYEWCPCVALERIPQDVREKARAIRSYKRQTAHLDGGAK